MSELEAWMDGARRDWQRVEAMADGVPGTRDAILSVWRLMSSAPSNVRDLHRGLDERELRAEAEAAAGSAGLPPLPDPETGGRRDAFWKVLAVTLRALELRLISLSGGSAPRRGAQCRATSGGLSAYLVPMEPRRKEARSGSSFRNRGLVHFRVLPDRVGDFRLSVTFAEHPMPGTGDERRAITMAAGLFEGIGFDLESTPGGFRVLDATARDQAETIRSALRRADDEACLAVVFPELTIGSSALRRIKAEMAGGSWEMRRLGVVVAGTRHAEIEGDWYNVATVLDRYGGTVAEHRKLFRFCDWSGSHEDIALGDAVEVVVVDGWVMALGVCLDFCNLTEASPYPELDVDFVLVPSCGGRATMQGHVTMSGDVLMKTKARSLVVQQHLDDRDPSPDPPLGYVLARTGKSPPDPERLMTRDTWTSVAMWKPGD